MRTSLPFRRTRSGGGGGGSIVSGMRVVLYTQHAKQCPSRLMPDVPISKCATTTDAGLWKTFLGISLFLLCSSPLTFNSRINDLVREYAAALVTECGLLCSVLDGI